MPIEYEDITPDDDAAASPDVAQTERVIRPTVGTDLWFAKRFAAEHGDRIKYVAPWASWLAYSETEGRWIQDASNVAIRLAIQTAEGIMREALALPFDSDDRKKLLEAGVTFQKKRNLAAGIGLAVALPEVYATTDEWDSDPWSLNCLDGVLDLRTLKLRAHSPADRMRKNTGVAWDPEAECPRFVSFLTEIQPNPDIRQFLQRCFGYSAIGCVREHIMLIAWGCGANGKGVLFNTVAHALGDYAGSVSPQLLIQNKFPQHDTIKADLFGMRLAVASETASNNRFDEAQLKFLTGGDTIKARRMREDPWEFEPSHTLWLQTNHKPRVHEDTAGFWRRIRLIPFPVQVPANKQDGALGTKLAKEAGGVLRWIAEGAKLWYDEGLNAPPEVIAATDEYRADQDTLLDFASMFETGGFTTTKALHEIYVEWCREQGVDPWGQRTLTSRLKERGGWDYTDKPARGFRVRRSSPNSGVPDETDDVGDWVDSQIEQRSVF